MSILNAEEVYQWYVNDVIKRNDAMVTMQEEYQTLLEGKTAEDMLLMLEDIYKKENEDLAPQTEEEKEEAKKRTPTDDNDFKLFCENIRANTIWKNFQNRPEFLAAKKDIDNAPDAAAKHKIVEGLYPYFSKEITEQKLEDKTIRYKLASKTIERLHRRIIRDSFFGETNSFKDKGNCTKGIIVTLLHMEREYGISLFPEKDKENIAHPNTLASQLENYQKTSESGLLKDIQDIKVGDIVLLLNNEGRPKHAMMVSGFNEQGIPLLLGFSDTQKNILMSERKADGQPRKGIVIDVHAFIKDKVNEHNRKEMAQIMFLQQKRQSVK